MRNTVLSAFVCILLFCSIGCDRQSGASKWTPTAAPQLSEIRQLACSGSYLFAGGIPQKGASPFAKMDLSIGTWFPVSTELPVDQSSSSIVIDANSIYFTLFSTPEISGSIRVSPDLGNTWPDQSIPLPELTDPRCLNLRRSDPPALILGSVNNGIFLSQDNGTSWQIPETPLDDPGIQSIAVSSGDPNHLVAGTRTGVSESLDGGLTWTSIGSRITEGTFFVVELTAHPLNKDCFVCIYRRPSGSSIISISLDGAMTWKPVVQGFSSDFQARCIAYHPSRSEVLFAGTVMDGVYRTDNLGEQWYSINKGLPLKNQLVIVHALAIQPSDPPILFAGTNIGGSIYQLPL